MIQLCVITNELSELDILSKKNNCGFWLQWPFACALVSAVPNVHKFCCFYS